MFGMAAVAVCVGVAFVPTANADLAVVFNSNATLNGTVVANSATSATMDIDDSAFSTMEVLLQEVGGSILGITSISNFNGDGLGFDLNVHMDFTRSAANVWAATGTFSLTDVDTSTPAISAAFSSTSVAIKNGTTTLEIEGSLAGNPLLDNRPAGGPGWTYAGEGGSSVTVPLADEFDSGLIFALQFNTGFSTLDGFFGASDTYSGGKVEGSLVPAPASGMLAMLGIGMIGFVTRRTRSGDAVSAI